MADLSKEEQELFDQMQKDEPAKEPEPKAEAKAEAKPEEKPAPKEEKKEAKVVPAEALAEARAQNRELRKELDAMKALVSEGDKKLQTLLAKVEAKADAGPNFSDDPAGHLKHENEQLKKGLAELQAKVADQEKTVDQNSKINQHAAAVQAREAAFAKEHKDYFQAAEYIAEVWRDEFREAGFEENEIPKLTFTKSLGITNKALQAGKDPAAVIYNLAKRAGYAAKQEAKKDDGESKLKTIEKGLEAAKSAGGGGGPDTDAGLSGLAQLDDAELEKRVNDPDWWNKNIRRSPLH